MPRQPKAEVHARIALPEGMQVTDVDKALWSATPDDLKAAVPGVKIVPAYTCLEYHPDDGLVYCGLTDFENELLWTYDPNTNKFAKRHLKQVTDKYDTKIHRSFAIDPDSGLLYCASATLQQEHEYLDATGGKIFRHDPKADRTEVLAVPMPHVGIQTICLDPVRQVIYGHGYPLPLMFAYHIAENRVVDLGPGTIPHGAGVDKDGNLWGTHSWHGSPDGEAPARAMQRLWRYNPDEGQVMTMEEPPEFNGARVSMNIFYQAPDEDLCYIGTGAGALFAFDPKAVTFRYIGKPLMDSRLEGLQIGSDGILYGCGGAYGSEIFAYDRESDSLYNLGPLADPDLGIRCIIPHDMTMDDDDVLYCAETDMTGRSTAAVWQCQITW